MIETKSNPHNKADVNKEKEKEVVKMVGKKEKLVKKFESWLPDNNVSITKEEVIKQNITAEDIYQALLEAVKKKPSRLFKDITELRFEVETAMYFDKNEHEWKATTAVDPLFSSSIEFETEDIVKELEDRKEEIIKTIEETLKDLKETEDEQGGESVVWALSIYFN